jgi:hypothetical protein
LRAAAGEYDPGKPAGISFVQYLYIPTIWDLEIDVTTRAGSLTEISFGFNASVNPTGNVINLSSEYTGAGGYSNPRIIWTHKATNRPGIPGYEIISDHIIRIRTYCDDRRPFH